jgi:hypothetical protein
MQNSFLDKVSQHIVDNYADDTEHLCIVLPNRRAGLFLRSMIGKKLSKPVWSPTIVSIEDFIIKLSNHQLIDNVSLMFRLYNAYKECEGDKAQTLDEFLNWGQSILGDFNEVDMHLADAEKLFSHLSQLKDMEAWNPETGHAGNLREKYLEFYYSLRNLYKVFTTSLLAENAAYYGLACRMVHENPAERCKEKNFNKVIFAGFNAFSISEERIAEKLVHSGLAETLWDTDTYYLNDIDQEAGSFIRKYIGREKLFKKDHFNWVENGLSEGEKNITIIGVAKDVGQAKTAGDILQKAAKEGIDFSETALVLADENLLFPMLHSLPDEVKVNVTMGFPLKNHPLTGLFQTVFTMQETEEKLGGKGFYFRDVLHLFNQPYFIALTADNRRWVKDREDYIRVNNRVFIRFGDVAKNSGSSMLLVETLFNSWQGSPVRALHDLLRLCELLKTIFLKDKERNATDAEFLFSLQKILTQLQTWLTEDNEVKEIKTLALLFKRLVSGASLPFYGEPLTGLQVMGMLETRTLDFENVILLSASEGFLPAGSRAHSFIPYEIKREYGIPVTGDKDSIFAYHFYRLLQRAKNIHILYNTEPGDFGGGEKSRFIRQLQSELPRKNPNAKITELLMTLPPSTKVTDDSIVVEKNEQIMQRLFQMAEKGFSPSALNTYKSCKLQFYFQNVEQLRENEEVEETLEADTFGTLIHAVLEEFYKPLEGKEISKADIKAMQPRVAELTQKAFANVYKSEETVAGKNLISLKIAQRYVERFLQQELEFVGTRHTVSLIKTEQKLEGKINVNDLVVNLRGTADRIDRLDNRIIRVIDYKTGKAAAKEITVKNFDELAFSPDLNKAFQLFFYAWLYWKSEEGLGTSGGGIQAGIISFKDLSAGVKALKLDTGDLKTDLLDENSFALFEKALHILLTDVFSSQAAFTQTDDLKICGYCSFAGICRR